jgi:hypothetical protein
MEFEKIITRSVVLIFNILNGTLYDQTKLVEVGMCLSVGYIFDL